MRAYFALSHRGHRNQHLKMRLLTKSKSTFEVLKKLVVDLVAYSELKKMAIP